MNYWLFDRVLFDMCAFDSDRTFIQFSCFLKTSVGPALDKLSVQWRSPRPTWRVFLEAEQFSPASFLPADYVDVEMCFKGRTENNSCKPWMIDRFLCAVDGLEPGRPEECRACSQLFAFVERQTEAVAVLWDNGTKGQVQCVWPTGSPAKREKLSPVDFKIYAPTRIATKLKTLTQIFLQIFNATLTHKVKTGHWYKPWKDLAR